MNSRQTWISLCIGVLLLAGCAQSGGPGDGTDYYVAAHRVESAPEEATVIPANDSRIRDVEPIQRVITKAAEEKGAQITVSKEVYENVTDALAETPLYGNEPQYSSEKGLYVDHNGTIIRVGAYSRQLA